MNIIEFSDTRSTPAVYAIPRHLARLRQPLSSRKASRFRGVYQVRVFFKVFKNRVFNPLPTLERAELALRGGGTFKLLGTPPLEVMVHVRGGSRGPPPRGDGGGYVRYIGYTEAKRLVSIHV